MLVLHKLLFSHHSIAVSLSDQRFSCVLLVLRSGFLSFCIFLHFFALRLTHKNALIFNFKDKYWPMRASCCDCVEPSFLLLLPFCPNICGSHYFHFFPFVCLRGGGTVSRNTISLIKTVTEFTEIRNSLGAGMLMMCKDVKLQQGQRQCKRGGGGGTGT